LMTDETDSPKDAFEPVGLNDELMDQLRLAKERAQDPPPAEEWTPEEQAELNSELARIPFDPAHDDDNFAKRTVKLRDEDEPIHAFNSFPTILGVVDAIRNSSEPPDEDPFKAQHSAVAEERKYFQIFEGLQRTYPLAYKRSLQIYRSWRQGIDLGLSQAEQQYILSQTYSAAAHIAQSIDPDYPLDYLRR
jgi:hypothetical protein